MGTDSTIWQLQQKNIKNIKKLTPIIFKPFKPSRKWNCGKVIIYIVNN